MTIQTEHGVAERVACMVKPDDQGNALHRDLAVQIDEMARRHMAATGEKLYPSAVRQILKSNSVMAEAYAHYTSDQAPRPAERPEAPRQTRNVSDYVVELANLHVQRDGVSFSAAVKDVLQRDPEIRHAYAQFTGSRK